jgi:hypothetical protein
MALVAACSFDHASAPTDSTPPPDMPPDVTMATWQIDSASKKGVPAAPFEWTGLLQAAGVAKPPPDHLWLMQEASGSLSDSNGAAALIPFTSPSYGHTISGWTRRAVGTADQNGTDQGFGTAATGNLDGTSYLLLAYVAVLTPPASGERSILGLGANTDHRYVAITPTPVFKGTGSGGVMAALGTVNPMATVHPVIMKFVPTLQEYVVYTDQEKLTVGWTPTMAKGAGVVFGNGIIGAAAARYLYGALWVGAPADTTDADIKKLLQALGWTVTGY